MKKISSFLTVLALLGLTQVQANEQLMGAKPTFKTLYQQKLKQRPTPSDDKATLVHIVPHSYNLEFLKSVNEYFPQRKEELMQAHYDKVFDAVVQALSKDKSRTFTHYEVRYFANWYQRQSQSIKNQVKAQVQLGQFEFVNGAWELHDSVCPHYSDMLLNIQKGHLYLSNEFQTYPRVAWNLDPFGHTDANARLFSESGIEALYLRYVDPHDREERLKNKAMEWIWRPNFYHSGRRAEVFTHVMYDFEVEPFDLIIDAHKKVQQTRPRPPRPDSNKNDKANDQRKNRDGDAYDVKGLREYVKEVQRYYKTKHILMFIGAKTNFEDGDIYFDQLDQLISEFNSVNTDIQLTHSTLSFYDEAIQAHDYEFPTSAYDLVPLTDNGKRYFTGLYTSRPNFKAFIRRASQDLLASNKLFSMKMIESGLQKDPALSQQTFETYYNHSQNLQEAVSEAQSTDGISGLGREARILKISQKLQDAIDDNNNLTASIIGDAAKKIAGIELKDGQKWSWCVKQSTNYLDCPIGRHASNDALNMIVAVYNPSIRAVNHTKIAVPHGNLTVKRFNESSKQFEDADANVICDQMNNGMNDCWVYVRYLIQGQQIGLVQIQYNATANLSSVIQYGDNFKIENEYQYLQYKGKDEHFGALFMLQKKKHMQNYHFGFDLRYYPAYQGFDGSRSGAAIFRPATNTSYRYSNLSYVYYQLGSVVSQITLEYFNNKTKESATVRARVYPYESMIEWDVQVDEIPVTEIGKEVTVNFRAQEMQNYNSFFTDINGLQMEQRFLNFRPNWISDVHSHQNISVNYFPVTSAVALRDYIYSMAQMTIMTSRTQGGSVLFNSTVELMHSRRLFYDDKYKIGVVLNDSESVQSTYFLQFFDRNYEQSHQREHQLHIDTPMQYYYGFDWQQKSGNIQDNAQPLLSSSELSTLGIPELVKIEYFPLNKSVILVRLENLDDQFSHRYAVDPRSTSQVKIYELGKLILAKMMGGQLPTSYSLKIDEMSLSGNEEHVNMIRDKVEWQGEDDDDIDQSMLPRDKTANVEIALEAQRIRTFRFDYNYYAPPTTNPTNNSNSTNQTSQTTIIQ